MGKDGEEGEEGERWRLKVKLACDSVCQRKQK